MRCPKTCLRAGLAQATVLLLVDRPMAFCLLAECDRKALGSAMSCNNVRGHVTGTRPQRSHGKIHPCCSMLRHAAPPSGVRVEGFWTNTTNIPGTQKHAQAGQKSLKLLHVGVVSQEEYCMS